MPSINFAFTTGPLGSSPAIPSSSCTGPQAQGRVSSRASSLANCSVPESLSTRAVTSSFCRTPWAPANSSKPSDSLRARFPRYNYDDMVMAQYRLLTDGLGIRHLRLVIGSSMGGMQTWIWGETYPDFMDGLVPMASLPAAMSGRNWMMRRMLIEAIRQDPDWNGGEYLAQPRSILRPTSSSASPRTAELLHCKSLRPHARPPTDGSTNGSQRLSPPTPTISYSSGRRRATTTRLQAWSALKPRCLS